MSRLFREHDVAVLAILAILAIPAKAQSAPDSALRQAMQQGMAAMSAGNFNQAVAAYTTVTRLQPGLAEGFFNLGLAEEQAGQLDQGRISLEKAVRLKPSLRGVHLFLGTIAYKQNHFKEAEQEFLGETRIDPRSAKAFMWVGVCQLALDDPQGAIAPLDKAYALDPSDADILYHRGRAYLLVANASYAAMFKLNHDSMRVHQVLAEAYAQGYRNQEAIGEFELAIKMAPHQPGLHEELGDQYWITGQLDKVAAAYREELKIDPYAVTAKYKLGCLLVLNQQSAEGVELLREALRADPTFADAHYYLATGLMGLDQYQDAIGEFRTAIAADPTDDRAMSAWYKLAQVYRKLHEPEQAQTAIENFQRMRGAAKERQEQKSAQMMRKRSELPVSDPEKLAMTAVQ